MPCNLAISSMSLGWAHAGHSLSHRLDMAQKYGYKGIELFHEDITSYPKTQGLDPMISQLMAAKAIRTMCDARNLSIVCLQPFSHYEGLLDRSAHTRRLEELKFWIQLAHILDTDMIQIPSNFLPPSEVSSDPDLIVADLVEAAELGLKEEPVIRFAYESLGWGTRIDTWEKCWDIVRRVNRRNFGMCLDTFNIACRIYADPASSSPMRTVRNADEVLRQSMQRLVQTVDVSKVFYVQVVDAQRLEMPLREGHPLHVQGRPARMSWSRNCRLFYGEQNLGAYLPVRQIAEAIFKGLGYEGWVSLELFNAKMADRDDNVAEELAARGARSWARLVRDLRILEKDGTRFVMASL